MAFGLEVKGRGYAAHIEGRAVLGGIAPQTGCKAVCVSSVVFHDEHLEYVHGTFRLRQNLPHGRQKNAA